MPKFQSIWFKAFIANMVLVLFLFGNLKLSHASSIMPTNLETHKYTKANIQPAPTANHFWSDHFVFFEKNDEQSTQEFDVVQELDDNPILYIKGLLHYLRCVVFYPSTTRPEYFEQATPLTHRIFMDNSNLRI